MSIKLMGKIAPVGRFRIKLPYVLPLAVGTVTTTAISATTATLSYVLTPNTSYEYSLNGTTWFPVPGDRVITGLSGSTAYNIRVRAVNRYGAGASSAPTPFSTVSATATWDPNRKAASIILSNNNLTVQSGSNSAYKSILATKSRPARTNNKVYMECKMYGVNNRLGLADDNLNVEGELSTQNYPCYYYGSGEYIQSNNTYLDGTNGAREDIIMMAWDGYQVYFGRNGTWNTLRPNIDAGMPTNANGKFPFGTAVYPSLMILGLGAGERVETNFGPNFTYTPPAGYGPW